MGRLGAQERAGTGQGSRALVSCGEERSDGPRPTAGRALGGRPMASFLTQLIVAADPAMRSSRTERTRDAAALYARAGTTR